MQEGARLNTREAKSTYEAMIATLITSCKCDSCQPAGKVEAPVSLPRLKPFLPWDSLYLEWSLHQG